MKWKEVYLKHIFTLHFAPMISYKITNSMIAKIETIRSIRWVIENAKIVPEWQQKLKKIARLRSAVFSTKIEWSQIDLEWAQEILDGKTTKARPRDKQELLNYLTVLDYIESREKGSSITEKDIFKIHALTTKEILSEWLQNKYREQQNAIYNKSGWIVYMPPEWKDVPKLMSELLDFINTNKEISPIIRAGILHHWFVIIHPFIDGNGRTARALTQLFLYQNGFNTKKFFSLEEYYDTDLKHYYESINIWTNFYTSLDKKIESTKFVEYFLSGLEYELIQLKKHIEAIKEDESFEKKLEKAGLTNRQIHFVVFIKEKGRVKSSDFLKKFDISSTTLKRELQTLKEKWLINVFWTGKTTTYGP